MVPRQYLLGMGIASVIRSNPSPGLRTWDYHSIARSVFAIHYTHQSNVRFYFVLC